MSTCVNNCIHCVDDVILVLLPTGVQSAPEGRAASQVRRGFPRSVAFVTITECTFCIVTSPAPIQRPATLCELASLFLSVKSTGFLKILMHCKGNISPMKTNRFFSTPGRFECPIPPACRRH